MYDNVFYCNVKLPESNYKSRRLFTLSVHFFMVNLKNKNQRMQQECFCSCLFPNVENVFLKRIK